MMPPERTHYTEYGETALCDKRAKIWLPKRPETEERSSCCCIAKRLQTLKQVKKTENAAENDSNVKKI